MGSRPPPGSRLVKRPLRCPQASECSGCGRWSARTERATAADLQRTHACRHGARRSKSIGVCDSRTGDWQRGHRRTGQSLTVDQDIEHVLCASRSLTRGVWQRAVAEITAWDHWWRPRRGCGRQRSTALGAGARARGFLSPLSSLPICRKLPTCITRVAYTEVGCVDKCLYPVRWTCAIFHKTVEQRSRMGNNSECFCLNTGTVCTMGKAWGASAGVLEMR